MSRTEDLKDRRAAAVAQGVATRGIYAARAENAELWDADGKRYIDFAAGIAVASTGHSHPKVVKAIQEQAERFIHISSDYYHEAWVALGEKLNEIAPFKEDALSFMTN